MDSSYYKDITVHGTQYHYYRVTPTHPSKPNLLFLHGFPSSSEHWVHQITYFINKGYGVIAPDMLGYGGTSKPEDPKAYDRCTVATHIAGILDAEGVEKVVVVAHDWGSTVASRLANLYPERHLATIFLALGYWAPQPDPVPVEVTIESVKKTYGHDLFSYWKFFAAQESPQLLAAHEDSFYSLIFPSDYFNVWRNNFAPEGELKKWLVSDKRAPIAPWAPDRKRHDEAFRAGGWIAPTNWYRSIVQSVDNASDKDIPKDRYSLHHPVLLVTTLGDAICLPSLVTASTAPYCTNLTIRELDTGHWVMLQKPDELNTTINEFLQTLKV